MDWNTSNEKLGDQRCCVCGEKATSRCSECAKVRLDVFFCSTEHQKLVWKDGHSKMCGPRFKPLLPPPLSPDEIKQAVELMDEALVKSDTAQLGETTAGDKSILAFVAESTGTSQEELRKELPDVLQNLHRRDFKTQSTILATLRFYLYALARPRKARPSDFQTIPVLQHMQYLTFNLVQRIKAGDLGFFMLSQEFASFQQSAAVFFTLARHATSLCHPLPQADLDRYCVHAAQRVFDLFCQSTTLPSKKDAEDTIAHMAGAMVPAFPGEVVWQYDPFTKHVEICVEQVSRSRSEGETLDKA